MVTRPGGLSATELASKLRGFLDRKVGPDLGSVSQRELSRLTGLPRATVQDFLKDPERRRSSTIARIAAALESPALQITRNNLRTMRVDAPVFTRESLRALSRPDGATGFQFVYQTDQYDKGFGQTILSDIFNESPEDSIGLVPGGANNIVSVLWYKG